MTIWWMILLAGVGTYLMRSAGVWIPSRFFQANWLNHLPFAVILVMAAGSVLSILKTSVGEIGDSVGAIAASLAVIIASLRNVPLVIRIGIGCIVFGICTQFF